MSTPTATSAYAESFTVTGMTCGHCVGSVTSAIGALPGVTGVEVDLPTGKVAVTGTESLADDAVAAAVAEAGYEVAPRAVTQLPQAGSCCGGGGCS
ncbi:cation transporter [Yinghuangia seranimata]|uniref:cation transporter n=1 Tax=Yinghuangia seranimata TaxID=408067 RepID=UPI00248C67AC|nr:cation transporter [Yinghuangia seranimata]MDI2131170.1 cation transporter [Yinghuangia seranimata]